MFVKKCVVALAAVLAFAATMHRANAQDLKSPDDVKKALQMIMHVTNDFDRQITRKTYARLPHENQEFGEASEALVKSVANEPAPFKAKVDVALKEADAAAQAVSDKSSSNDEAVLRAGHAEMLKKVNALFALFPEPMRPDPNFMFSRPQGQGAPPPTAAK